MAGLVEHHQKEEGRLAGDLAHLDVTLKLFFPVNRPADDPGQDPPGAEPLLPAGECQRMVLDISGEAQGAALSSRQMGEALVVRQGLEATIVVTRTAGGAIVIQDFRLLEWVGSVTGLVALGALIFGCGLRSCAASSTSSKEAGMPGSMRSRRK